MSKGLTQELISDEHGILILEADGKEYTCAHLDMTMAMGEIPTARVTIGFGKGILYPNTEQNPEDLLEKVVNNRNTAYTGMLECSIYEFFEQGKRKGTKNIIFKGVIVTASPSYAGGTRASHLVSLVCMNKICLLLTSPLTSYINSADSWLINKIIAQSLSPSLEAAQYTNSGFSKYVDANKASEWLEKIKDADIVTKVNRLMAVYLAYSCYTDGKDKDVDKDINSMEKGEYSLNNYLFSKVDVAESTISPVGVSRFYTDLAHLMAKQLEAVSIYDMVRSVLSTDTFMLNMVPRWAKEDFRLELTPSYAWAPKHTISLTENDIESAVASFNPVSCVNTPQVFIVTYEDAPGFTNDNNTTTLGYFGVYSIDKELMSRIRTLRDSDEQDNKAVSSSTKMYRVRAVRAPKWLYPDPIKKEVKPSTVAEVRGADRKTVEDTKKSKAEQQAKQDRLTKKEKCAAADLVAQALFTYVYASQDKLTLTLPLKYRFGYSTLTGAEGALEDHIGDAIDLTVSDGKSFAVRGIIDRIQYVYTTGTATDARYIITLRCVRPKNNDINVPCPLYTEIKGKK